jgi:hypothetical protein
MEDADLMFLRLFSEVVVGAYQLALPRSAFDRRQIKP